MSGIDCLFPGRSRPSSSSYPKVDVETALLSGARSAPVSTHHCWWLLVDTINARAATLTVYALEIQVD